MGRGRRTKRLGALLLTLFLAGAQKETAVWAAENTVMNQEAARIEQVYVNLPEAVMYGSGIQPDSVAGAEAYLSQEKLSLVQSGIFRDLNEGICYYVLLDISGSIPDRYFVKVKEGIRNLQAELGEKDKLVLCTFGESVALAADGSQTAEELEGILAGLDNGDQKTLLFEGIDQAAALAATARGEGSRRQILAVISDGEDIAVGKKMAAEAQETLKETGLPAYAFCIRDTATVNINSFGEFARTSGGELVTFQPEEGTTLLTDLRDDLEEDLYAEYRADTNVVTNKEETFSLRLGEGGVLTRNVMNVHWIPDDEPPRLLTGELVGERQLRLTFSEPMSGLEAAANYQIFFEGEPVGVSGVAYDKENDTCVTLTLTEPVQNGTYEIRCANITDVSMEKNPLEGNLNVEITQVPPPETEAETEAPKTEEPRAADYTGALFLVFAAVVALAIVMVVKLGKKKPEEKKSGKEEGKKSGSVVSVESSDSRQHIRFDSARPISLDAVILVKGKNPAKTRWELSRSLIVGRASICDIFFDDAQMSRQHFCLERDGDNILISDLDSTNGTSVNGIAIKKKRRLQPGDTIEAGSIKITLRW